jgi:hypothetical protein
MSHRRIWALALVGMGALILLTMAASSRLFGQSDNSVLDQPSQITPYVYQLQVGNIATIVEYADCIGLGSSSEILESTRLTEGGAPVIERTPGALRWGCITLKRSEPSDQIIWDWRKAMEDGDANQAFRDGSIIMLRINPPQTIAQWTFHRGWVSSLTVDGSTERLTIVHDRLDRVEPSVDAIHKR